MRVHKIDINKLVNIPTSLHNLKIKENDFDVGKLKTFCVDLEKLTDVVDNQVVKNTKVNRLNTKINKLDKEILDATTLIRIN